ncbi:hypothetical protein JOE44_000820 [Chryseobacterium sp. PvR013]|nr:hypothetical protein [Chryseobacterium sp. PvR013]
MISINVFNLFIGKNSIYVVYEWYHIIGKTNKMDVPLSL